MRPRLVLSIHASLPPNDISIGSAVFARHTRVPNMQTDTHTERDTQITLGATGVEKGHTYTPRIGDAAQKTRLLLSRPLNIITMAHNRTQHVTC